MNLSKARAMKRYLTSILILVLLATVNGCSAKPKPPKVLIKTNLGDIEIVLYDQTPQHRDNFLKLVEEEFYDSLLFHRVIRDFMIQAGDPKSKGAKSGDMLGGGGPGYRIPAEFVPELFHKKGALSAARQGDRVNPEKESSGSQFYIVQGKVLTDAELDRVEKQINSKRNSAGIRAYLSDEANVQMKEEVIKLQQERKGKALDSIAEVILDTLRVRGEIKESFVFTEKQRSIYKTVGGTPFLDTEYTVFGEVTKGLDILDKIAAVPTNNTDRPLEDVVILKMERIK